tara:strand:+ start:677 stop:2116 length:1440 start_codon:yes stop_codon:yes gene_type:complete
MGLLDGVSQNNPPLGGAGQLIDLGLDSKIYYEGEDGVQNNGVDNYGNYQFTSLEDIINSFLVAYVGEDKLISKVKRTDVAFHAQRSLAELSFDTLKSTKSYELEVPPSLVLPLPQDYIHYTCLSLIDNSGIKKRLYPISKSSNPIAYQQNSDGTLKFETNTWKNDIVGHPDFEKYSEYGITRSYDSFGNQIVSDNNFVSKTPLRQYAKEVRVNVTGAARVMPGNGNTSTNYVAYGPGSGLQINFQDTHADIEVGMSVFGPGIPENSTVASVGDSTSANYEGTGITITNPAHEANQLLDSPVVTAPIPGYVETSMKKNTQIIIVDLNTESNSWEKYKAHEPVSTSNTDDYEDDTRYQAEGRRYGIDPQHAQDNGSYYIDSNTGLIHFSSVVSGQTIVLDYISDSLGTEKEMKVHKFAEQAMYMCIAHAILSVRANVQEYVVRRFKKDRFAAVRQAKLRLSNLKLEELTQILRGKSKQIKH